MFVSVAISPIILLAAYFLPTIVTLLRGRPWQNMLVWNLLLGWTGIGYLVMLFTALVR